MHGHEPGTGLVLQRVVATVVDVEDGDGRAVRLLLAALGGGFLLFPIGDRRCNRTRASVGNAGGNARPSLTNATAASRLLHRRSRSRFEGWPNCEGLE